MLKKVLVVCIGNICRSPVAEALLVKHFEETGRDDHNVASAGIHAVIGKGPDPFSKRVIEEKSGIDITDHEPQQITPELLKSHDLILVMDESQQRYFQINYPYTHGKVQLLGKWIDKEIADPYGMPYLEFEKMHDNIVASLNGWIGRYWPSSA